MATVKITQTGVRRVDDKAANAALKLSKTPDGFVWHHVEDGVTMQLLPKAIHGATGHTGGVAIVRAGSVAGGVAISTNAEASSNGFFGITIGDVGNFVIDILTPGGVSDVGAGSDIRPNASGGFVLYPNKPNTNMLQKVYSK